LIHFLKQYGNFSIAHQHLVDEVVWPHFFVTQIWLFVLFLIYCTLTELMRVLGSDRIRTIFFGDAHLNKK